jgi:hypothetical protein
MRLRFGFSLLLLLSMVASACGDDDGDHRGSFGDGCADDRDCAERCVKGGDWPGGMCTYRCNEDRDCPPGTACVDKEGGVCAFTCSRSGDCPAGYGCRSTKRESGGGEVLVCRGG